MATKDVVYGSKLTDKKKLIFCKWCAFDKHHWSPFPKNEIQAWVEEVEASVHTDHVNLFNTKSIRGEHYFIVFTDDHSAYQVFFCIAKKSQALKCFKSYVNQLKQDSNKTMRKCLNLIWVDSSLEKHSKIILHRLSANM
jgi:galactose-1-phosphate uridylyltransferase